MRNRKFTSCLKGVIYGLLGLAALILIGARFGLFAGQPPGDLGVTDGRLKPPSPTRNSVSSQAALYPEHPQRDYAQIAPLELVWRPHPSGKPCSPRWRRCLKSP